MKIAIDCRYLGKSGIGRLCEGFLQSLDYSAHDYYLIGKPEFLKDYSKAHIVVDNTEPYSLAGLRSFDKRMNEFCEALIVPNFLVPFGVKIPVHSVMHDLIFLDLKETTRGAKDRLIKKMLLKRCMKRSKSVACVSKFTLSRCEHYYGKLARKCYVNYTGLSKNVLDYAKSIKNPPAKENYIVFVGNVKKHKGLELLLDAFSDLKDGTVLKIIGEKDTFLTGLKLDEHAYQNVVFTGKISDEQLFGEISKAKYLVLPSKYEGFGLPPIEALCLGTQPIVSDIPVFREIYSQFPVKFFKTRAQLIDLIKSEPQEICVLDEAEKRFNLKNFSERIIRRVEGNPNA